VNPAFPRKIGGRFGNSTEKVAEIVDNAIFSSSLYDSFTAAVTVSLHKFSRISEIAMPN
jgi:hypothetical protein